jgi:hypothetical protein
MELNVVANAPRMLLPRKNITVAKKAHTDKNLVVVNIHSRKVGYLSPTKMGKKHDKKQADEATIVYPLHATLGKDTGFQGYEPANVLLWQPKKKPKGRDLAIDEVFRNGLLSATRISVEHALAGVKRCRIVKDVFRNTKLGFSDIVMEIACALHNLRVHFRQPLPVLNLVQLALIPYSE